MAIKAKLDARPDRIDLRDKQYSPPLRSLAPVCPPPGVLEKAVPLYLEHDLILDQGQEGACTGFGLAATINSLFWRRSALNRGAGGEWLVDDTATPPEQVSTRMLYHLARIYDEWPGEDYQGSSCRGAIKAWFKHGVCSKQVWPYRNKKTRRAEFISPEKGWQENAAERPLGVYYRIEKDSVTDMQAAIQEVGAIYCSANVHTGWGVPSKKMSISHTSVPVIDWHQNIQKTGGHAFALVGYNEDGFVVQNSWGKKWGNCGFAILTYKDWANNGSDAWVCVLGAKTRSKMPNYFKSSSINRGREALAQSAFMNTLVVPQSSVDSENHKSRNIWNTSQAYAHSVVMGNDGKVINRLVDKKDGQEAIRCTVLEDAQTFFQKDGVSVPRLLIYAHGGLNSEGDSLERIKVLGPYLEDNNIYPVFLSWKTGLLESVGSILEDASDRMFPSEGGLEDFLKKAKEKVKDALDRTIEVASENLGVKAIWSQMKQNAAAASMKEDLDRGAFLTTLALAELKKKVPALQIHLVGHSAGSIILGHMLDDFPRNKLNVASCSLYAPACSIDFAIRHYQKAIEKTGILKRNNFHIHLLSDENERADTVGPYRKSLLYLVSRALEDHHKTPLLGMQAAFDATKATKTHNYSHWYPGTLAALRNWQKFWGNKSLDLVKTQEVTMVGEWQAGELVDSIKRIDSAHGAFDNDIEVLSQTIRRVTKKKVLETPVDNLDY